MPPLHSFLVFLYLVSAVRRSGGKRVLPPFHLVLQLRLHDEVKRLKAQTASQSQKAEIDLTYVTRRGPWYHQSWKGNAEKSGTVAMNIGIHFFDMLLWLFGPVERSVVHLRSDDRVSGFLELERARVRWLLSIDVDDLPDGWLASGRHAYRALTMGEWGDFDFSTGFDDLHTKVYQDVLAGGGYGIEDARPSIELVHRIRFDDLSTDRSEVHPWLNR